MIKPPRNIEVGLAQSKKIPKEQNMSWGNIQLLAHRCLQHLPTNSLTICYSGLKSCNHKHLFLAPLPTARLPCAAHCYKFDLGIGQTGGGRDGGVVFQQDCFPWLVHSTKSSAGTKLATAETIWGTFSTWPQVGGATPAQLLQAQQSISLKKALLCSSGEGISFCVQLNRANCCSSSPQLTRTNPRSKTGLLELPHTPLTCLVFWTRVCSAQKTLPASMWVASQTTQHLPVRSGLCLAHLELGEASRHSDGAVTPHSPEDEGWKLVQRGGKEQHKYHLLIWDISIHVIQAAQVSLSLFEKLNHTALPVQTQCVCQSQTPFRAQQWQHDRGRASHPHVPDRNTSAENWRDNPRPQNNL